MSSKINTSATLSAVIAVSLAGVSAANADTNPFGMTDLSSGYLVADSHEGKCGEGMKKEMEGKCGEGMKKKMEGKCGEGKCGEGKCGEAGQKEMMEKKMKEGKCGGSK